MSYQKLIKEISSKVKQTNQYKMISDQTPGFYLAFESDGNIIYEMKKGLEDIESGKKIGIDTFFLTASLTKPIIKNFILNLDDDIFKKRVSFFIKCDIPELTIQHLVNHQGGLFDETKYLNEEMMNNLTLDEVVSTILSKKVQFRPGEKTSYSNSGYMVLTKIIEVIFNQKYEDVVKEYYTKKDITFDFGPNHKIAISSQYLFENNKYEKIPIDQYQSGWGAGALLSSPKQYLKFMNEVNIKDVLMQSSSIYGPVYSYAGGFTGVSTVVSYIEKLNLTIILFVNFNTDDFGHYLINVVRDLYDWEKNELFT